MTASRTLFVIGSVLLLAVLAFSHAIAQNKSGLDRFNVTPEQLRDRYIKLACGGNDGCQKPEVEEIMGAKVQLACEGSDCRQSPTLDELLTGKYMLACDGGANCKTPTTEEVLGGQVMMACNSASDCYKPTLDELLGQEIRLACGDSGNCFKPDNDPISGSAVMLAKADVQRGSNPSGLDRFNVSKEQLRDRYIKLACNDAGNCFKPNVDEIMGAKIQLACGGDNCQSPTLDELLNGKFMLACDGGTNCKAPTTEEVLGGHVMLACGDSGGCYKPTLDELLGQEIRLACRDGADCFKPADDTISGNAVMLAKAGSKKGTEERKMMMLACGNGDGSGCKSPGPDDLFRSGLAFEERGPSPLHSDTHKKSDAADSSSSPRMMMLACSGSDCPHHPEPDSILGDSIRTAMALPSESAGSAYGFSSSKSVSPASKAFTAGMWNARESISGKKSPEPLPASLSNGENPHDTWQNSPTSDYYRLGWWLMHVQAACHFDAEVNAEFWKAQVQAQVNARKVFVGRSEPEAKTVVKTLDELSL